ncbi:MAG TPA: Asd/ArgC dimerization domain-containing protein [Candidatus Acidoferrum sp.]|nr:Asd/ArgC dimerization domain-containing protein [Candidatus Acidoferrum sp.]
MAPTRIVIAGASSLLGAELKSLLEESRFAAAEFRLVDEEIVAGTLTEAGGEAAVIQPVEEDSFHHANLIFFTGSAQFTAANLKLALASGAKVVDLSGMPADREASCPWFPQLPGKALAFSGREKMFSVLSAPAACSSLLSLALNPLGLKTLSITHFRSVSEAGREGIEELESQTAKLLSLQPAGSTVFGTQVAFNLLDGYGPEGKSDLASAADSIRFQVAQALGSFSLIPAINFIQAPVFYGAGFSAIAELEPTVDSVRISQACREAGFRIYKREESPLGTLTAAGEEFMFLSEAKLDPSAPGLWWLFGAADNIRLPAFNAVKLAERLLP